jgi:hypothetical protein
MDANLQQRRASLTDKVPDIRKTLAMVNFLRERRVRVYFPILPAHTLMLDHHRRERRATTTRTILRTRTWARSR